MVEYTRPTGTTLDFSIDSDNSYTRQTGTTLDFEVKPSGSILVSDASGVIISDSGVIVTDL